MESYLTIAAMVGVALLLALVGLKIGQWLAEDRRETEALWRQLNERYAKRTEEAEAKIKEDPKKYAEEYLGIPATPPPRESGIRFTAPGSTGRPN